MSHYPQAAKRGLSALFMIAAAAVFSPAEAQAPGPKTVPMVDNQPASKIFGALIKDVQTYYINPDITEDQLVKSALEGMSEYTARLALEPEIKSLEELAKKVDSGAAQESEFKTASEAEEGRIDALKKSLLTKIAPANKGAADKILNTQGGTILERAASELEEQYPALAAKERELIEAGLNGMLTGLDPHSSFFDEQEAQNMQEEQEGAFGGVGLPLGEENGVLTVGEPFEDSPAARAKVQEGDVILKIDGQDASKYNVSEAAKKVRGRIGTNVELELRRKNIAEPITVTIRRDTIKTHTVKSKPLGDKADQKDVGYISIGDFVNSNIPRDLDSAVRKLSKSNSYIIDLRYNPGGIVDIAEFVAGEFLSSGEIVHTEGRTPDDKMKSEAAPEDATNGKPIVVLVNGLSASASEIVAGALQGNKRAIIVGTPTYGKGSVQTVKPFPLIQGTELHYTTGLYFTPMGSIQGLGIIPDILAESPGVTKEPHESDNKSAIPNPNSPDVIMASVPKESCTLKENFNMASLPADFILKRKDKNAPDVQLLCAVAALHGGKSDFVENRPYSVQKAPVTAAPSAP